MVCPSLHPPTPLAPFHPLCVSCLPRFGISPQCSCIPHKLTPGIYDHVPLRSEAVACELQQYDGGIENTKLFGGVDHTGEPCFWFAVCVVFTAAVAGG